MSIPTIDISPLFGQDTQAKLDVGKQIDAACRVNGFFQISNHKIDLSQVNDYVLAFFKNLSTEKKLMLEPNRFNPNNKHAYRGYTAATVSGKETFDIANPTFKNADHKSATEQSKFEEESTWPDAKDLPGFREFFEDYFRKLLELSRVLLRGFALGLGKEETFWDDKVSIKDTISTLRLNFYPFLGNIEPVTTDPDGTKLGCPVHKDSVLITILLQEIEGLYSLFFLSILILK